MKTISITLSIMLLSLVIMSGCTKEPGESVNKNLTFVKAKASGCNNQIFEELKSTLVEYSDTVSFSGVGDTLDVFIGINYICCATFESESVISNDSIIINITDICTNPYQDCYCKCMCYYTWNILFVDFEEKEYNFKIILNDPREENPIIFREGKVLILSNK